MSDSNQPLLIVSCSVTDQSEGLRSYRFDAQRGALTQVAATGEGVVSPIHATVDPGRRFVYVADHVKESDGKPGGAVAAYAVDRASGKLTFLNRQSSRGLVPCYVSVTADLRHAFVANYGGGNVAMLPILADGRLGPACDVKSHAASAADEPRAHCILPDPANRFAFAADLGVDRIFSYQIDGSAGRLVPNDPPFVETAAKAGPRHLAFHPNGQLLYAMTEYDNTVIAMRYAADMGRLEIVQVASALPEGYSETSYGSDIHIHPHGRWLFAANRGHDSIVTFAVDADTGRLTWHSHTPTGGSFPRSFVLDPTGAFLLVGNEKSNEIRIFKLDANTGALTATETVIQAPAPAGLLFV